MALLGQRSVTRRQFAVDTIDGATGRGVPGATTDTTILASIQVLSGRDIQNLVEWERVQFSAKCYTETALFSGDDRTGQRADRIIDTDGTTYEVRRVDVQHPLIGHWKAFLQRLDETGGEP